MDYAGAIIIRDDQYDSFFNSYGIDGLNSVRPAITLKSGTELSSGDGTINNPYTIK